ncbi:MAG: glycosyltransferase [Thermacetogeniaceae bacterium]
MKRVLIASPVRQRENILKEFLWSLDQLETDGLEVWYAFIDDCEEESRLLKEFAARKDRVRIIRGDASGCYRRDETTHHWSEELIWKVAEYKDRLLGMALEQGFDFVFLVDSDLVLHPKTLKHLVALDKDIVSEVYFTKWMPEMPPMPQVWVAHDYRLYHRRRDEEVSKEEIAKRTREFLELLKKPGTYRVGGLGGCTLISREAISRGVSFKEIYNLDLKGEDRHFCIRAAALGLELYADTHYPPYHIYRESDLDGLEDYKRRNFWKGVAVSAKVPRITLGMLVRNEADRYLRRVLEHARRYIDDAVILDDASTDGTVEVCREALRGVPLTIVSNKEPMFHNEVALRKQLWELVVSTKPQWILILDADEMFEERAVSEIRRLLADASFDVLAFRLYDMWDEHNYRDDEFWRAHLSYRPFIVRYIPGFCYEWRETPVHCGRFPKNITELRAATSELRVKHLGWIKPSDRLAKYRRYKEADPFGRYGSREQYLSILDPKPKLSPWCEEPQGSHGEKG